LDLLGTFIFFLTLTVALLVVVVYTGRTGRRRVHLAFVLSTLVSLTITIVYAKELGEDYDLEAAGAITAVHLTLAKICVASFLPAIVTGYLTFRGRRRVRRWHASFVWIALALTLVTVVTGTAMMLLAEPLPDPPAEAAEPAAVQSP